MTNLDNETIQVFVEPATSIETSESGASAVIRVRLSTTPTHPVRIAVNPDSSEIDVGPRASNPAFNCVAAGPITGPCPRDSDSMAMLSSRSDYCRRVTIRVTRARPPTSSLTATIT